MLLSEAADKLKDDANSNSSQMERSENLYWGALIEVETDVLASRDFAK